MKKILCILGLLFILVLVINVSFAEKTATASDILTVTGTDKVAVTNWALVPDRYRSQFVIEFTNIGEELIPDFEVQAVFYDKDGGIIDMVKDGHDAVLPGSTVITQKSISAKNISDYKSIEVMIDTEKYTNHYVNHADQLEIKDSVSGDKVFLQVVNNDSVEISEIEIVVVYYDKNNTIIGASEDEVHHVAPGAKQIMEFSRYNADTVDHYKYYVNQAHTW